MKVSNRTINWGELRNYPSKPAAGELRFNCIFCDDESYHLYVNTSKKVYHCFKCEASGHLNMNVGTTDVSMYDTIAEELTKVVEDIAAIKPKEKLIKCLPPCERITKDSEAYTYLANRGISWEMIARYGIVVSTDTYGRFANTVIFPNFRDMKLCYFVCRRYKGKGPKYINAPWPKEDILFYTTGATKPRVIVEGIFDALNIPSNIAQAIAILGKRATRAQLDRIVRHAPSPIIVMLDRDALSHAVILAMELRALLPPMSHSVYVSTGMDGKDPSSSSLRSLEEEINRWFVP